MRVDVGIVVVDLERSLGFYRDVLGLAVVAEVETSLIGKGRMVQLRHGESRMKLVQMEQRPALPVVEGLAGALGYRYVTLVVADVRGWVARLEQAGVRFVVPLTVLENGAVIVMVEDPDGNIIELVEETKSESLPNPQMRIVR